MVVINGYGLFNEFPTGIHRNTLEILGELDKIVAKDSIELVVTSNTKIEFGFENIRVVKLRTNEKKQVFILSHSLWNDYRLKKYVKRKKAILVDLLLAFPAFGSDIVMVYDCIPQLYPSSYQSLKSKIWAKWFLFRQKRGINKAKLILTDSNYAKGDIERFYPKTKGKIEVIPCGWQHVNKVDLDEGILKKFNLEKGSYFFSLGSRLVHKNIKWVIEAAKQNQNEIFVATGRKAAVEDGAEDLPNFIYTGYLTDSEIKTLMKYCKAFIHPSFSEGFGIPPMEAMSVGARCIVSTGGSLPEVYGKSVWYIEPGNYENIDLKKIMSAPIEPNDVVLNKYSWKRSAEMFKDVLDRFDTKNREI